ncbi:MAG: NUDIX hydrolase, partial [Sporichthyaceae bacterium]|nr:NUDIX hydrolase [Sporichthyaceae bacterium]
WAERIQAIAQTGLAYARDPFDLERYRALRALAVEIAAAHLELPEGGRRRLEELFAADAGYPTPKVDVRAFVSRDRGDGDRQEVLLVRERVDGGWSLPGGWADPGWSPAEMAVREVAEESGYQVRAGRLLALWDRGRHNPGPPLPAVYKVCVGCTVTGGRPAAGVETLAVGWFPLGELPELSSTRVTAAQIRRLAHLHAHPELPPDLD